MHKELIQKPVMKLMGLSLRTNHATEQGPMKGKQYILQIKSVSCTITVQAPLKVIMAQLIPTGDSMGIKIPPHLLSAAHLDLDVDLFFEVTDRGLLLTSENTKKSVNVHQAIDRIKSFRKQNGAFSQTEIKSMLDEGRT
jgi:hypothetical protein